jgi:dTDP-4-dehydrorhamnose reductase
VVADQHGAPTWSRDLARMAAHVIGRCEERAAGAGPSGSLLDAVTQAGGVYHAAGAGETTWFGFAAEAIRQQRLREPGVRLAEVDAIATAEYPTPARRPENSRLKCSRLAETLGWRMMPWERSLEAVLAELATA